jgi:hypothetical protein
VAVCHQIFEEEENIIIYELASAPSIEKKTFYLFASHPSKTFLPFLFKTPHCL